MWFRHKYKIYGEEAVRLIIVKKRTIVICLTLMLICMSGAIFYFKLTKQTTSKNYVSISSRKVEEFNSLVPGVFILNLTGEKYNSTALMFESLGFDVTEGDFNKYVNLNSPNSILIANEADIKKLNADEVKIILNNIKDGQRIITIGDSTISKSLGIIGKKGNGKVKEYTWYNKKNVPITFKDNISIKEFEFNNSNKLLAYTGKESIPVAVSGVYGKGRFIYSAIPLAPSQGSGYEYYPFIMEAVRDELKIKPVLSRYDSALYVDPGFHLNEKPSDMAERIKNWGFDQVNIGLWCSIEKNRTFIKTFIDECHKRGIKVYAWFEYPMVSIDFWNEHPEWREKTAKDTDAHIDWRYLMAMEDPKCLEAIKQYTKNILFNFDFDGADIAEIYFEPPGLGFKSPETFTPMHPYFRKSFEKKYGYDPKNIFNPVSKYYWAANSKSKQELIDYRIEIVTNLHKEMLDLVQSVKKEKPYLQTVVTFIDSLYDKDMKEHIGVDSAKLAQLQNKYGFVMQIEDPFTLWKLGPERYKVIGKSYREIMNKNGKMTIDINIIDRFGDVYPTKKQRGLELYELTNQASQSTDKVMFYALATLEKDDMELFPYAESFGIKVKDIGDKKYSFDSTKKFVLEINTRDKQFYIDGSIWPLYSEKGVIIPAGKHILSYKDAKTSAIHIEDINSEINTAAIKSNKISLSYNSDGRCFIILNKKPSQIKEGNRIIKPKIVSYGSKFTITLPQGKHDITIR